MRFSMPRSYIPKGVWRPYFAWHPILIKSVDHKTDSKGRVTWKEVYVWWEWVESDGYTTTTKYRLPEEEVK